MEGLWIGVKPRRFRITKLELSRWPMSAPLAGMWGRGMEGRAGW